MVGGKTILTEELVSFFERGVCDGVESDYQIVHCLEVHSKK